MANDVKLLESEPVGEPTGTSTPRVEKRCATESTVLLEHASTPFRSSGKKRLVLECDRTPLAASSLNSSSRSLALSTPGRVLTTSRMISITRGIQTCPPTTSNRYCQVSVTRIPKPTASASAQTDESLLLRPVTASVALQTTTACSEIACQTDVPPAIEKSVATTQTISFEKPRSPTPPPIQREDAECQTNMVEEIVTATVASSEANVPSPARLLCESDDSDGPMVGSISNMLNEIAKQYGIDLQSSAEKKKKKKSKVSKKKQIDHLERCLVNKTYKAIASKVDKQLSTILEKRAEEYGRQTMASRQQLVRWTKSFIRRQQQQKHEPTASAASRRKVLLVRKVVRPAKRPPAKERGVQCVTAELMPVTANASTQWQRQKPMVTKKKPAPKQKQEPSSKTLPKKCSTSTSDSKTCSAGAVIGKKQPMRQTKMSSYAKEQTDRKAIQGRQQRKQQGECSPKASKSAVAGASAPPSTALKASKKSSPPPEHPQPPVVKKKTSKSRKPVPVPEKIHIEETPSDGSSDSEPERKHFPYRSPPRYPSQCSKATETSFLTPTRIRNLVPIPEEDSDRHSQRNRNSSARDSSQILNPSVLLSPMERMFMERRSATVAQTNNREYNTFLLPLRPTIESIPPTPPRTVYVNHPERRLLLRSRHSTGGTVREKPPEISIISSQQLYSQIGLAVEKALKAKTMPTLDTMYGDPYIEVFNGTEQSEQENLRPSKAQTEERATKKPHPPTFVCSSGRDDVACLGTQQQHLTRPPFHTERSPSLSPIVYQDDNSGDELML